MGIFQIIKLITWKASLIGLKRGPHITRYSMYSRLKVIGSTLPTPQKALSISHSEKLLDVMGIKPKCVIAANYPDFNMLSLDVPDSSFDMVVSDQVLEHVAGSPQQAINECARVLSPGGIAVHTTCFINPIHGAPSDYWRFTEEALSLLHKDWEVIEVGSWGNFEAWSIIRAGLRFEGVPHATWHPLHKASIKNDPLWPIVTWVVAAKRHL